MQEENTQKTPRAQKEEKTLNFWKENQIFEKTLKKSEGKPEFVFYEGPPTANAKPALHHLISRAFKDVMPRYKTMQGYFVRRRAGWDTHGLPVELQVEKALGFKSKKDIEEYGVAAFNAKCKENVWQNIEEWQSFTERIGYWVDQKNAYVTYKPEYMETLWWIMSEVEKKKLLYKDYRIVPWCPRCGTALSSHELAQGYAEVRDLAVTAKFKLVNPLKFQDGSEYTGYLLAWTTTPWTLPGNLGLAVGPNEKYVFVKINNEVIIIAENKKELLGENLEILYSRDGDELEGMEYEPLYPYLNNLISGTEKDKLKKAFHVYPATFVTADEGTGIVHTAVMYGADDFDLGTKVGLPKFHMVDDTGHFIKGTDFLEGRFVKDEDVAIDIIKNLAHRGLLFKKETIKHTYPFCWRCKTPLLYYARDSWYIAMSKLRDELVSENKKIHWEPEHIQEGRFGEWLREVKDWAISRERYWGTPLPVWVSPQGNKKVIGSIAELQQFSKSKNTYTIMRHGEAENNALNIISSEAHNNHHLTEKGKSQIEKTAEALRGKEIDFVYSSPFLRTRETTELLAQKLGIVAEQMIYDERLSEINTGKLNLQPVEEYHKLFSSPVEKFTKNPPGGETLRDVKKRIGDFIYSLEKKYTGKNILIITHEYPLWMLDSISKGYTDEEAIAARLGKDDYINTGEVRTFVFTPLPHDEGYYLDLHRPYIDEIKLTIEGEEYARVPEVMDVWFDSGAMPFAQVHYPFENADIFQPKKAFLKKQKGYPADYISEAIDQTRGWFYTLLAVGTLLGFGTPYKNVISLGHILDEKGKKMSKSIGNILDPWALLNKYGADTLRFWMFTINQPGESKNFDEKTVVETQRKTIGLLENVVQFYEMYGTKNIPETISPTHILDRWICSLYAQLVHDVTDSLDNYKILEAGRAIRDFIGELSQWYLRRSRDRFRGDDEADKKEASQTLGFILLNLSKLMAPFMPFVSEEIYKQLGGEKESVHLEEWPKETKGDENLLKEMELTRKIVEEALALRNKANIKVRQPLVYVSLWNEAAARAELLELLKDEINVKEVRFDKDQSESVVLHTIISDELRREGEVRDLIRAIQDLRKEKGLQPGEKALLTVTGSADMQKLVDENKEILMRMASLTDIATKDGEFTLTLT